MLLLLDFLGVGRHGPAAEPAGVVGFASSVAGSSVGPAGSVDPPPPPAPGPLVPVGSAHCFEVAVSAMFSANSSSSMSKASSHFGVLTALALLYNLSRSMLTTLVPLFFSCPAQEGSGAIVSSVSLLVGSAHTIHGPDQ